MKFSRYAIFVIAIVVVTFFTLGCTGTSSSGDQSTPTAKPTMAATASPTLTLTPTPTPTPAPTPEPTPVPVQTLTGTGNQASDKFHLNSGLAIFKSKNVDNSQYAMNFIVYLLDSNGNHVDLVANDIGTAEVSAVANIQKSGDYLFDVTSTGSWSISVEQPKLTTAQSVPATLKGSNSQVSEPFYLKKGLVRFASKNVDNGQYETNFIVYLVDSSGNSLGLVANDIGTGDSSKAMSVSKDGVYMLKVTSGGDWEITVTSG